MRPENTPDLMDVNALENMYFACAGLLGSMLRNGRDLKLVRPENALGSRYSMELE